MKSILFTLISLIATANLCSQDSGSQGYIQTAYNAIKAQNYQAAIENYSNAINAFDEYPPAYYGRGLAYFNQGNMDNARLDFERAISLEPDYFEAYYALGMIDMKKEAFTKAIRNFDKCLTISNAFPEAYYARASSWYNLGKYDKALVDYNKTIQIQPSYSLAYYGRGITYKQQGMKGRAIEDLEQYKKLAGNQDNLISEVDRLIKEASATTTEY